MKPTSYAFVLFAFVAACDGSADKTAEPRYDALASAKADGQVIAGALAFDAPQNGNLSRTVARQTWTLDVRPGATVDIEITRAGTTAALDTVLTVVGPVTSESATTPVVAEDDDSGWGLHSRIRGLSLPLGTGSARYLVTVQSYDGKQKGKYRLAATCRSGNCAPTLGGVPVDDRYCHPAILRSISGCIDEQLADPERDPGTWTGLDVGRACVDAEAVAPSHDAICAAERPAPTWCALDYELFMTAQVSLCEDTAVYYAMGRECALGANFGELRNGLAGVAVTHRRVITEATALTALEGQQLVAAAQVAYEDVRDVSGALEAVDGGEVNQLHVWDATAHRGFVVYEYGAGDNSYGGVLAEGGKTVQVQIRDGDYTNCPAPGPELRLCVADADCDAGMRCTGVTAGRGRCVAPHEFANNSASCQTTAEDNGCGVASGLICSGVDNDGRGLCLPVWQRGRFEDYAVAHLPAGGKLVRTLTAYGLTTVSTDVTARIVADFATPADLRITLTNPATTVGVVWGNEAGAGGLRLERQVRAFPGDESANGEWVLTIENRGTTSGTLVSWGLDIQSRWD